MTKLTHATERAIYSLAGKDDEHTQEMRAACDGHRLSYPRDGHFTGGSVWCMKNDRDFTPPTCPRCLVLMDEAMEQYKGENK